MPEIFPPYNEGEIVDHRYRILQFLGEGGVAYNYLVRSLKSGKKMVLKQTKRNLDITGGISEDRFQVEREFRTLLELDHPFIPRAFDIFNLKGALFFTREYRVGRSLEDIIRDGMDQNLILRISGQILYILQYLHNRNIIYRDLKPSNILVDERGNIFLFDFGTCRYHKPGKECDTISLGTPGFAAPEQYGRAQTDCRSDIYSFGALLYYVLTGDNPEDNPFVTGTKENLEKWNLDGKMSRILEKCLALRPSDRYHNVDALRKDLFTLFSDEAGSAKSNGMLTCGGNWVSRFIPYVETVDVMTSGALGIFFWSIPLIVIMASSRELAYLYIYFSSVVGAFLLARHSLRRYSFDAKGLDVKGMFNSQFHSWDQVKRITRVADTHYLTFYMKGSENLIISSCDIDNLCRTIMLSSGLVVEEIEEKQALQLKDMLN